MESDIIKTVTERVDAEKTKPETEAVDEISSNFIMRCLHENSKGDALLFNKLFAGKFLFCKGQREWYVWDQHHWRMDIMDESSIAVERVAQKYKDEYWRLSKEISTKAADGADKDETRQLYTQCEKLTERARQLRGSTRRAQCLDFAHTVENSLAISGAEFDNKQMLFPCANGVIDLETGKLKQGRPGDYLSAASPIEYRGIDDPPELWIKSLCQMHNCEGPDDDRSIVEYIQRLFGYAITGHSYEKIFPIFYGKSGWNGRSLILETVKTILGDMAAPIPSEMLLSQKIAKSASGPSPDVMSLKGLRIAFASETDENQRFSASKIKWYTGNNELIGRWPNDKRPIRFHPTHTLILETNYQPQAPPNDRSFWERVHLIPFNISYVNRDPREPHERRADLKLREKLKTEYWKILGWLIEGCLKWQRDGLKPPVVVTEATAKYRENEDMIGDFVDECCAREPLAKERGSHLYNRFVRWYHDNHGKNEPSGAWFGKQLSQKFEKNKSDGVIVYHGLRLSDIME
ncbi:MAG: phage/plasmid primase, P4 family [Smithella sp.]|jgi:putative DNA primase/helicase